MRRRDCRVCRVEVVPVQDDRHQEQRPEQEAEPARGRQRGARAALAQHVTDAGHQPGGDFFQVSEEPGAVPARRVRAELVLAHGHRDQARREVTAPAEENGDGGTPLGIPGERVEAEGEDAAGRTHDPANGRGHRVGHDQRLLRYHVRQRGTQRGEEEPVHGEYREHAYVQGHTLVARHHQRGGQRDEHGADQRRPDQDLPSRPAVDEYAGERADQGVRQVQHRERGGARRGAGKRGGIEEHVRADPRGDDSVACLRHEPGREQPPETALGEDGAKIPDERRPPSWLRRWQRAARFCPYGHFTSLMWRTGFA